MNKTRHSKEIRERIEALSNALLGEPEDISYEEAQELLSLSGIDLDATATSAYEHLRAEAERSWAANKPIPKLLKTALDDLRPSTEPPRTERQLQAQAKARIERIVEAAKSAFLQRAPRPAFQVSNYRKKSDVSDRDKSLLDDLANELNQEVLGSDERNES